MSRYPTSFSLLAAALVLGGCAAPDVYTTMRHADYVAPPPAAVAGSTGPTVIQPESVYTSNVGRIESLTGVTSGGRPAWRLNVRMDNGTTRVVDTFADGVMVGRRVQIENDGRVNLLTNEPVATSVPRAPSAAAGGTGPATESRWVLPRSGTGTVESLTVVPNDAGFVSSERIVSVWRVGVRMDDGTVQVMDAPASGLAVGKRVRISNDGYIARAD
jgi:hypothetical protein